ncbi:MAG: aminotransferase class IV, partial [Chloroflexota bacterium]
MTDVSQEAHPASPAPADAPGHIWLDGRIMAAEGAHISAFDRGFQLGDGIFETLRARGGRVTELREHLIRLQGSATGLDIKLPVGTGTQISRGITALLEIEGLAGPEDDASIRVTVTRGSFTGRGLLPPSSGIAPTIVIQAWPVSPPPPGHLTEGLHLVVSSIR